MKIIKAYPPNWTELTKHFPIKGKQGILYAWGDTLYNPNGVPVTPWIMAHEEVHGWRQNHGWTAVDKWWERYVNDNAFRFTEELDAHKEEWRQFAWAHEIERTRLSYLDLISKRLSSPLYGSLVSYDEAKRLIVEG